MTTFRLPRPGGRDSWDPTAALARADVLRWLYLGRVILVSALLLAALWIWTRADPTVTLVATTLFIVALTVTAGSFWWSHFRKGPVGRNFLYGQVLLDIVVVTAIVHLTGGGDSTFAWLYILVISEGALLLPLPGGVLVGVLAAIVYFADIVWGHSETLAGSVLLQVGVFTVVAIVTGILGDRLRSAGMALGAVESELRRLRVDTTEILETITTGIVTLDAQGRLVYMNPAAERLLAMDARQWVGAPALSVIAGVAPELVKVLRQSLSSQMTLARQTAVAYPGTQRRVLGVSTTLRVGEGMPSTVTAIFQDITDLEKLEALNRRTQRLEAVAELSAAMAHEIKNPLASIRSAVEQFSRPALDNADRETLTRMVVRESERLSRLLSDFIDFSRVRIGKVEPIAIEELIRECVAVARRHPHAQERGIAIEFAPPAVDLRIPADADLLHRALFNLVLNAVQFSPEGGTVRVEVEDLRTSAANGRVNVRSPVRIGVRDSGPGVPESEMGKIFDPFYTTREGGSGLGLSVVHRAVEAHHGVILVERWEGGGAEFSVYLPGDDGSANGKEERAAG
jgi:two-component system sensor histidine kinase PilS (NtrC family)